MEPIDYYSEERIDALNQLLVEAGDTDDLRNSIRDRMYTEYVKPRDPFLPGNLSNSRTFSFPVPVENFTASQLLEAFITITKLMGHHGFRSLEDAQKDAISRGDSALSRGHTNEIRNFDIIKAELIHRMKEAGIDFGQN